MPILFRATPRPDLTDGRFVRKPTAVRGNRSYLKRTYLPLRAGGVLCAPAPLVNASRFGHSGAAGCSNQGSRRADGTLPVLRAPGFSRLRVQAILGGGT